MISTKPKESDIKTWLDQPMIAKGGGTFIPSDNVWRPDPTANSANVVGAKKAVPEEYQQWLVVALAFLAKEKSARSLVDLVWALKACGESGLNVLDSSEAIRIRDRLTRTTFSSLRVFLRYWHDLELDMGPNESEIAALFDLKPKPPSQCPVESLNPIIGPYTQLELQAIFDWVNRAFADNKISWERFVYIRLLIATGARQRQIQQLVFGDISLNGQEPILQMPKAKLRTFEYRSAFQSITLSSDLYEILSHFKSYILRCLKVERPGIDWNLALPNVPLFRSVGKASVWGENAVIIDGLDLRLLEIAPQEKFHKQDGSMKILLKGYEKMAGFPISERTQEPIHLGSHRFRYTLGTDMASEGYGPHPIASALGHNGIKSVGRYIKTSPKMGKRLDNKMKESLVLVVNAFQGCIISRPDEISKSSVSMNQTIRGGAGAIATCGSEGGCHLDAPTACYTCSKFQPWVEADHEEVLQHLEERQRRAGTDTEKAISFDRSILAVRQVIDQVNKIKSAS